MFVLNGVGLMLWGKKTLMKERIFNSKGISIFQQKVQFELTLRWEVVEVGLMNVPSISEKKQKLIVFILGDDHGHLRGFDQGIRIGGAERSQATGRTASRQWRQTRAGDNAEGGEDNFSDFMDET